MAQLPEEVLRHVATFLPYNDRINLNICLPKDQQYVKKLDSDAHNAAVKVELLSNKINSVYNQPYESLQRLRKLKSMMLYLLHTKDTCLFEKIASRLYVATLQRTRAFTRYEEYGNMLITHRRYVISTIRVAEKLVSKLESFTPVEDKMIKCRKLVQIA